MSQEFKEGDWVHITDNRRKPLHVVGVITEFKIWGLRDGVLGIIIKPLWKEDPNGIDIDTNYPNWWPLNDAVYTIKRWHNAESAV